ncbi:hypothetical protein CDAR_285711 [Caerostris darwini]|uniref:Uncharacterized protein n=1 Tax=Caerostris darwini TaxID=1538125 RepID=A0AAV4MXZ2_9ARAC|nr:hypothetical protein CDAR_285711 [Caerostris darwini]
MGRYSDRSVLIKRVFGASSWPRLMSGPDSRLAIKQVNRWTNRCRRVHQKYEECYRCHVRESSHSHELGLEQDIPSKKLHLLPVSDGIQLLPGLAHCMVEVIEFLTYKSHLHKCE